uniref:Uncharacterized protein n=1 Tax=Neolamprologus brichardi TaxID=32507 RepID=A0A3Q4H2Q5_NEOBR
QWELQSECVLARGADGAIWQPRFCQSAPGLLLRSLMSGTSGASRALGVFRRQQRANPESSLCGFIETLCRDEITHTEADTEFLTV